MVAGYPVVAGASEEDVVAALDGNVALEGAEVAAHQVVRDRRR